MACYAFDLGTGKILPMPEKLFTQPVFKPTEKVEVTFAIPLGQTAAVAKISAAVTTLGGKVDYVSSCAEAGSQAMLISLNNLIDLSSLLKKYPDLRTIMERVTTSGFGNTAVLGSLLVNPTNYDPKVVRA